MDVPFCKSSMNIYLYDFAKKLLLFAAKEGKECHKNVKRRKEDVFQICLSSSVFRE